MLNFRQNSSIFNLYKSFFAFTLKKINVKIIFFIALSFISSLLDIAVIYFVTNLFLSLNRGVPITEKFLNIEFIFYYAKFDSYFSFIFLCLSAYLIKIWVTYLNYYLGAIFGSSITRKFLGAFANVSYEFHLKYKQSEFVNSYTEDTSNAVGAINAILTSFRC